MHDLEALRCFPHASSFCLNKADQQAPINFNLTSHRTAPPATLALRQTPENPRDAEIQASPAAMSSQEILSGCVIPTE